MSESHYNQMTCKPNFGGREDYDWYMKERRKLNNVGGLTPTQIDSFMRDKVNNLCNNRETNQYREPYLTGRMPVKRISYDMGDAYEYWE